MTNEILFRRRLMANVSAQDYEQTAQEKALALAVMKNMEAYGFSASTDLADVLFTYNENQLAGFYAELKSEMEAMTGADKTYTPMYPNFPKQVLEADDLELFVNAVVHYMTYGFLEYEKDERLPLIDSPTLKTVYPGGEAEIRDMFTNIAKSPTSLSVQDKEDLKTILDEKGYKIPYDIPHKENAAYLTNIVWERTGSIKEVRKHIHTATDILRLAVEMSGGDASLAEPTKFKHMSRPDRRMIVELLNGVKHPEEDMYRHRMDWVRLGEIVHPGEMQKFKNANKAFDTLRNGPKPKFFAAKLNEAIAEKNVTAAVSLLKDRPGEFARNLDKMMRMDWDNAEVKAGFAEVAGKVSVPVLMQVREHFIHRNDDNPVRTFMPKGSMAKIVAINNTLPKIPESKEIQDICESALLEKFSKKPAMGKVYIDPDIKGFAIPQSQRSASSGTRTVTRGSNLPMEGNFIRPFIWWTNANSRIDLDLSVNFYDSQWYAMDHVSYTNLRTEGACHSGDITNGGPKDGEGVAEFIDIDRNAIKNRGIAYAVFQIYAYTPVPYMLMPNARFGWMEREAMMSGEIFEPKTVKMSMDLNTDSMVCIPAIYDVEKNSIVWCDMVPVRESWHYGGYNLESNLIGVTKECYAMVHSNKPDMYDLVMLNAKARGEIVDNKDEADIIFSNEIDDGINTYQIDYFYNLLSEESPMDEFVSEVIKAEEEEIEI